MCRSCGRDIGFLVQQDDCAPPVKPDRRNPGACTGCGYTSEQWLRENPTYKRMAAELETWLTYEAAMAARP